jgi:putative endonuclease
MARDADSTTGATTTPWRKRLGDSKERQARRYLEQHGLRHVANNVRCRRGELDLVMRDGDVLVFIEVRYRASQRFGGAAASIDARKQRRIAAAAAWFLQRQPVALACRFDVLALGPGDRVDWIRDAFAVSS